MKTTYSHDKQFIAKLKSIEQQINHNQLQDAALQLNLLGKVAPHDPRLFLLAARLAEAAGNPDGILQAARKAHQLAPQWATATLHLAGVLASRDDADAATEAMSLVVLAHEQAQTQALLDVDLLCKAARIAQRLGRNEQALTWLRQAEQLNPGDTGTLYKIGLTLNASGDFAGAVVVFSDLLVQLPGNQALLSARMQAYLQLQNLTLAALDGDALLALDPANEEYQFFAAIARGETPQTQPASLIANLFGDRAAGFDRHLVVQLQYKLPRDVAQIINQWHPDRKGDVLDLGCGTGLLGACLGPIEGVLVGVDLSGEMIAKAGRHHVYDKFHQVNVLAALQATPDSIYNVITALDVLIYVGNLDTVIPNAHRILVPGGRFVFSCEYGAEAGPDYALQKTYRYTHQRSYVQRLLEKAGFKDIEVVDQVLRYEAEKPVQGFVVTAVKDLKAVKKPVRRSPKSAKPGSLLK